MERYAKLIFDAIPLNPDDSNLERYACIRECKDLNYRDILRMLYDFKDCMVYQR